MVFSCARGMQLAVGVPPDVLQPHRQTVQTWCCGYFVNTCKYGVPFIVSSSNVALSHRKPAFVGISRDCYRAGGRDKRYASMYCAM